MPGDAHEDDAQRGRSDAEEAWRTEASVILTRDHVYAVAPIIVPCGLHWGMTTKSQPYVTARNRRTKELLAEHGLPAWAPAARIPSAEVLRDIVARAIPVAEFDFATREERHFRRMFIRGRDDEGSLRIMRVDPRTIAIVRPTGAIDLVDIPRCSWIVRVEPDASR